MKGVKRGDLFVRNKNVSKSVLENKIENNFKIRKHDSVSKYCNN